MLRLLKKRKSIHNGLIDPDINLKGAEHMSSYARPRSPVRVYVKVNSDFDSAGSVTPRTITWDDGRVFNIDAVRDFRPASTLGSGYSGDCYTIIIKGKEKHLFFERVNTSERSRLGRWWVESLAQR